MSRFPRVWTFAIPALIVTASFASELRTSTAPRSIASAREKDGDALLEARNAYEREVDGVRQMLLDGVIAQLNQAKRNRETAQVKALESELQALASLGAWPSSIDVTKARDAWQAARARLAAAIELAANQCRRAGRPELGGSLLDELASRATTNDLVRAVAMIDPSRAQVPQGWSWNTDGWVSVDASESPAAAKPLPLENTAGDEFELQLVVETLEGSGTIAIGLRDHDGARLELEFPLVSASNAPRAKAGTASASASNPIHLDLRVRRGTALTIDVDGQRLLGERVRRPELIWGSADALGSVVLVAPADSRTRLKLRTARVRPLFELAHDFFAASTRKDAVEDSLAVGREFDGKLDRGEGKEDCRARVVSSTPKEVVLEVSANGLVTEWRFNREGRTLTKIASLRLMRKSNANFDHLEDIKLNSVSFDGEKLCARTSWREIWRSSKPNRAVVLTLHAN